ncbi:alkaline phosphatase family protein [Desulforamulus ruminis]|uniref:alkaline phosphatase family protein n=1 Tax=Desulforamulus ruminis TaxID=1564 RepID=UPI0023528739|nr:alkaline phosphatase family protein [Desulforamulus ruminis]
MAQLPKKVIYIMIDSFHPRALKSCLAQGKLPALSFLVERGCLEECVSAFPTVTPVCMATLATGASPAQHGIPGFVWYHRGERRIIDYGTSWLNILKNRVLPTARDLLFHLNQKQLNWEVRTLYEELESKGLYTAAVNPYIYRGNEEYQAHIPFTVKLLTLFQLTGGRIYGPRGFCLGQIYQPPGELRETIKKIGFWSKFGVNDRLSVAGVRWFLEKKRRPDFLAVYFPDTDSKAHAKDPDCCVPCLTGVDQKIKSILDCFLTWEKALEEYCFVLVGDHAQSTVEKGGKTLVKLPHLLREYSRAKTGGEEPVEDRDIAICSNERSAYIYILRYRPGMRQAMAGRILKDRGVDQVMWKDGAGYRVKGNQGGTLFFRRGGPYRDPYGNQWNLEGDTAVLDLHLEESWIHYGAYPNALERIADCLDNPNAGELVVTARPGYLLGGEGAPSTRIKGSHGSLYREESLVPLIISGTPARIREPRLTDVVPFLRSLAINPQA